MKRFLNILFSRRVITAVLILLQAIELLVAIFVFSHYFTYFYVFSIVLSIVMILYLINKETSPSLKIPWLIMMTLVPIFGGFLYLLFGQNHVSKKFKKENELFLALSEDATEDDQIVYDTLKQHYPKYAGQVSYLRKYAYASVYDHSKTTYLEIGEKMFESLCEELEKAERFIFIESFIVAKGVMLERILEILKRKVKEGVDVRFLYDDIGCLTTMPSDYYLQLRKMGIKAYPFNQFRPILSIIHNNRDHRKITVIDGRVAFNGGINIADEYINKKIRFGHWKDSAVKIEGKAVNGFTQMFLQAWNYYAHEDLDFSIFNYNGEDFEENGYIQCYQDSPLDKELTGENVYLNIINQASRYVYITTPYLIIDHELMVALCNCAKRGVDIRLITPHIPDKWYVHLISQSNYRTLINAGVKIYEYTPGFIHAKTFVSDDEVATVGTINLDYRSLVHHYECGTYMVKTSAVNEIKEDFLKTQERSMSVPVDYFEKHNALFYKMLAVVLKLFAPLM